MVSWRSTALAASLALLAFAPAHAAEPTFTDTEIVINKSLAGVELYAPVEAGREAWGDQGDCEAGSCDYSDGDSGAVFFFLKEDGKSGNKISDITIFTRADNLADVPAWVQIPKTSKGIGIGSTQEQVKEAYPEAVEHPSGIGFKIESNGRSTYFGGEDFVSSIDIQDLANCRTNGYPSYKIFKRKNVSCDKAKTVTKKDLRGKALPQGWSCTTPGFFDPVAKCTRGKRSFKYSIDS